MTDFKIGDIVRLKSGSPKMTITSTSVWKNINGQHSWDNSFAECTWFDDSNKPTKKDFPKESLELFTD